MFCPSTYRKTMHYSAVTASTAYRIVQFLHAHLPSFSLPCPPPTFSRFTTRMAQRHSTLPLAAGTSNSSRCCFGIKPITPVRIGCVIFSHRIHTLVLLCPPPYTSIGRHATCLCRMQLYPCSAYLVCMGSAYIVYMRSWFLRCSTHTHTHNPHTQRPSRPHITMAPFPSPAERIDAGPGGHEGGTRRCC